MNYLKVSNKIMLISILLVFVIVFAVAITGVVSANVAYADSERVADDFDVLFNQTVDNLIGEDAVKNQVGRSMIYDIFLCPLGYVYEFSIDGIDGYAILISSEEGLNVIEFVKNALSPYKDKDGEQVYIREFTYAVHNEGEYYIIDSDIKVTLEELIEIGFYYCGASELEIVNYEIEYDTKTENSHKLAYYIPKYYGVGLTNCCMPVAGGNLVAYYDRYKENLIPDYVPGSSLGSIYRYKVQNETINNLISQLYTDMGTNTTGEGATISQFKNGLNTYCKRANYTISFEECMSNSNLNLQRVKEAMHNNKPVVLFVERMEIATISNLENKDSFSTLTGTVNHAMVGFGYKEIEYKLKDNSTMSRNFIQVATGLSRLPEAYLNLNSNLGLDMAYIVDIS